MGVCIPPGSFIPTAEQFGMIERVDRAVVRKALRLLAALPANQSNARFAINLSGLSIGDEELAAYISDELTAHRIDARRLVFEITESAACENLPRARQFIERVRDLGCEIALDDFGVGFSSFSYLKHLRADIVKIDGSFVREIDTSHEDRLFVKALVDVTKGMGIRTIAEFVERPEILAVLKDIGVDYAQGHYLGQPQSPQTIQGRMKPTAEE